MAAKHMLVRRCDLRRVDEVVEVDCRCRLPRRQPARASAGGAREADVAIDHLERMPRSRVGGQRVQRLDLFGGGGAEGGVEKRHLKEHRELPRAANAAPIAPHHLLWRKIVKLLCEQRAFVPVGADDDGHAVERASLKLVTIKAAGRWRALHLHLG